MMFSSTVIYLELFVALFFLPGFFITVILGIKKFRFLLSFALSYSLLVLTLIPFEYYAQPIAMWQWCVLLEWVLLAVFAIAKTFMCRKLDPLQFLPPTWATRTAATSDWCRGRSSGSAGVLRPGERERQYCRGLNLIRYLLTPRLIVPLVLAGVICGYLAYAGIYFEIPSDAWNHVQQFQWQKSSVMDNGVFPSGASFNSLLFAQGSGANWYFIHAWLGHVSSLPIMASIHVLTFVNVLTFLLAMYYFGLFLFAGLRIGAFKKMMMAAIASLFAAATMGNMVFAYIRYYAFAPTMLNYVLFLAAMALVITWLRSNRWWGHALWIAPILLIVTSTIHTQEALFIFFMTLALSLVESAKILRCKFADFRNRRTTLLHPNDYAGQVLRGNRWTVREWKNLGMAAVLLLMFLAGFIAVRYFKPGAWISAIIFPAGIPPEPVNFIVNKLLISLPQNFWLRLAVGQLFIFYRVVGSWGLFVYLLFILMFRQFIKQPYLIAGMVVPFLTAFNPLMVDMMTRMGQASTVYRFHYIIPLPFVGSYLFIYFLGKAREWFHRMRLVPAAGVSPIWPRLSWINYVGCLLVLAGLVGLIFPINAAGIYLPYSKIYTLREIPAGNDYHLCDDLGKIMAKYENKVILTDGWTSGYLAFYSPQNTYCHAKWLNSSNPENEPPEPYTWEKLRNRGLIIINRRDGALSITGKIAHHWPEDVFPKVSRNYSLEARRYLESHPETFRKIWSQNRIAVYAVR